MRRSNISRRALSQHFTPPPPTVPGCTANPLCTGVPPIDSPACPGAPCLTPTIIRAIMGSVVGAPCLICGFSSVTTVIDPGPFIFDLHQISSSAWYSPVSVTGTQIVYPNATCTPPGTAAAIPARPATLTLGPIGPLRLWTLDARPFFFGQTTAALGNCKAVPPIANMLIPAGCPSIGGAGAADGGSTTFIVCPP